MTRRPKPRLASTTTVGLRILNADLESVPPYKTPPVALRSSQRDQSHSRSIHQATCPDKSDSGMSAKVTGSEQFLFLLPIQPAR
ncbi:unnamed protein product [Arctogadus glacialis]